MGQCQENVTEFCHESNPLKGKVYHEIYVSFQTEPVGGGGGDVLETIVVTLQSPFNLMRIFKDGVNRRKTQILSLCLGAIVRFQH